ncbi:MAG TPA: hypothetical protein VNY70_06960 [Steroidobacteraceae bacterium]|jgi:hypothetical protein|nr:hypothetical protein [Steroidobacteraceae bacterium]
MSSSHRRVFATLTVMALAGVAGVASVDAQAQGREHRSAEGERPAARREATARPSHRSVPAHAQAGRAAPRREAPQMREHQLVTHRPEMPVRTTQARRQPEAGVVRESHPGAAGRGSQVSQSFADRQVRVVRYGNTLSGSVERTIRPGLVSRTFVSGGHVLYTHVYQGHVWHQFGRSFAYETFVPAVRYPAIYYSWALAPWPRPVVYAWGWGVQPWYPMYGYLFTPYPVYTSPDLWMTDYIIAQRMQAAYQAQSAPPPAEPLPPGAAAEPAPDSGFAVPGSQPGDASSAAPPSDAPPAPQPSAAPPAPPPAITPQVKAQLNEQIKVQLEEQQAAEATPATLTTQSGPPALRPNHVFFAVVQPLNVPTAHGHCSLGANDYIKRTGGMSDDDWMIPVVVELSRPADCPEGLQTRIGLNDLNAMENEQEAQVMEAMRAASKGIGPNGPPSGVHPTLIADGAVPSDPGALEAIRHAQ